MVLESLYWEKWSLSLALLLFRFAANKRIDNFFYFLGQFSFVCTKHIIHAHCSRTHSKLEMNKNFTTQMNTIQCCVCCLIVSCVCEFFTCAMLLPLRLVLFLLFDALHILNIVFQMNYVSMRPIIRTHTQR